MPYKFDRLKLKIPRDKDKRIKLDDYQRQQIRESYNKISQRNLAKHFKVSRSLIRIIGNPYIAERVKNTRKLNGMLNNHYYNKLKHNIAIKKHRLHKKSIFNNL